MAATPRLFTAEEHPTKIAKAIADWRKLSENGAESIPWGNNQALWQERYRYWSFFGTSATNTKLGWRYWNGFGTNPRPPRGNVLVEINPPQSGVAGGTQGLVALDRAGQRWILHGGRVHPSNVRVDFERFAELSDLTPVEVEFSDGTRRGYFLVAPLDRGANELHAAVARFVRTCGYVRSAVLFGREEAVLDRRVDEGEGESRPEKRGRHVIPARPETEAKNIHADVWHALAVELDRRGILHSNARVGKYGPDLRTRAANPSLFEIKTDTTARSIYEALGQLLVYESLLAKRHAKAIVVPARPPDRLAGVLKEHKIRVIGYRQRGPSYAFDDVALDRVLRDK